MFFQSFSLSKIEIFSGDLILAEQLYMEAGDFDSAVEMLTSINRWEEAIQLTERTNSEMVPHMRQKYLSWLADTKQLGMAGTFVENEGDLHKAIDYYLDAGLPGKAAKILLRNPVSRKSVNIFCRITYAGINMQLIANKLYDKNYTYNYTSNLTLYVVKTVCFVNYKKGNSAIVNIGFYLNIRFHIC